MVGNPGEPSVQKTLWSLAEACTPAERIADYTQAIMDLGATVCTRVRPACLLCPVAEDCVARLEGRQAELPSQRRRASRPQRAAWLVMAMRGEHKVLLERRPPAGIWGGLWALPEFPTRAHADQWCRENLSAGAQATHGDVIRHAFSHFDYEMRPLLVRCMGRSGALRDVDRYRWYDLRDPMKVGLPKPIATLIARVQPFGAGNRAALVTSALSCTSGPGSRPAHSEFHSRGTNMFSRKILAAFLAVALALPAVSMSADKPITKSASVQ